MAVRCVSRNFASKKNNARDIGRDRTSLETYNMYRDRLPARQLFREHRSAGNRQVGHCDAFSHRANANCCKLLNLVSRVMKFRVICHSLFAVLKCMSRLMVAFA